MSARLLYGMDVLEGLAKIETETVQCVVTSPPYWALRDYGSGEQQIGLEKTPEAFIERMVAVFREVRRVLRKDGVCWVNMGDGYANAGGAGKQGENGQRRGRRHTQETLSQRTGNGIKPKDLIGMPWMLAFALRADGWFLRSDVVWAKPNPMPESVTDRPTKAHEYVFLFTKSDRYYYDAFAIMENSQSDPRPNQKRGEFNGKTQAMPGRDAFRAITEMRNKRTVWEIVTEPYPEAHFATFPKELPKLCILAGTPAMGSCVYCGAPMKRVVKASGGALGESWHDHEADGAVGQRVADKRGKGGNGYKRETTGWKHTCSHLEGGVRPSLVLDPFSGSGTTGEVAIGLGRHYVGIDLQRDYLELAKKRIGLFAVDG